MRNKSLKVSVLALFVAFTLILSYIEFLIPISYGYGLKLGLANVAIVTVLYVFSFKDAMLVNIIRILISGFLFGNGVSIIFSLSGGIISLFVMYFTKRLRILSLLTVSILGAVFHNIGQIIAAFFLTKVYGLIYYLPVLIVGGIVTGAVIGVISRIIIKALKEIIKNDSIFKG